jgi:hypothetical protein
MDAVLNAIRSSQDPAQLLTHLNQHSNVISQQSTASINQALSVLDPAQHSLGYLLLL